MEAMIRINWTESNDVSVGVFSVAEARSMMHRARYHAPEGGGYDKVNYTLVIDGEDVFTGRCDVEHIDRPGNGDADPIAHTQRFADWVLSQRGEDFFQQTGQERPVEVAENLRHILAQLR